MINFRTLSIAQLRAILDDTGYENTDDEFAVAEQDDCFKYIGCANGSARYLVGFKDDHAREDAPPYYVSCIYVSIGHDKLQADYGGMPEFNAEELEEIQAYIEKRCN